MWHFHEKYRDCVRSWWEFVPARGPEKPKGNYCQNKHWITLFYL